MLIKALCEYADRLAEKSSDRPPKGWGWQDVSFRIMLSPDGRVTNIIDIREEKEDVNPKGKVKKIKVKSKILLPIRHNKSAIFAEIIEHRGKYIFGLQYEKGQLSASDKNKKSYKDYNESFKKKNSSFFEDIDSEIVSAYKNFIENWNNESEIENKMLLELKNELNTAGFCFALSGHPEIQLEKDEQFIKKYTQYIMEELDQSNDNIENNAFCAITGLRSKISETHDIIKFPIGKSPTYRLVSMKTDAFHSYGKKSSYNSCISETAMKKYTSAFNYLLSNRNHRVIIGNMVIVFFAIKNDENNDDNIECDLFAGFFCNSRTNAENKIEAGLSGALKPVPNGYVGDAESVLNECINEDVIFYVAGLTADSRLCQKFIYRSRFGDIEANLKRHTEGLKMCGNKKPVSFYALEQQLKPPKSKDYVVPPPLMTGIILAAIKGTKYPDALLQGMIRRVLTDSDGENDHFTKLNDIRAGAIKACINRKYGKEELTVALDVNNNNEAYLCGRLFAVLEKIQQDASEGTLNRTITDAYFSSAASKPSSVLPKLIQLSMNHQRKLSEQSFVFYNKLIGGIIDGLNGEFPQTLDLDGQGRFIVGYYQQKQAFYTKKTDDGKEG